MVFLPSRSVLFHMLSVETLKDVPGQWFQNVVPRSAASVSLGNLFKMQILGPYTRLTNQKLWRWSPAICVSTSLPGGSEAQ